MYTFFFPCLWEIGRLGQFDTYECSLPRMLTVFVHCSRVYVHNFVFFHLIDTNMSSYENVVGGKLNMKGKALDVKAAAGTKKKKKRNLNLDFRL